MMRNQFASRLLILIAAPLFMFIGTACGQKDAGGNTVAERDRPRILLLLNVRNNEFFRKIEDGFISGMSPEMKSHYKLDVRYCSKPSDITYQRTELESYIANYVAGQNDPPLKAVIIAPAGSGDEITAQIKQLRDRGLPVVIVDLRIKADALSRAHTDYSAYIGSQNRDGGILAADQMAKCLPMGGSILLLNGVTGMEAANDRRIGFTDRLTKLGKANSVQYKITERTANFLRSEGQSTVDGLLSMGQKFDGIFAANDEMALGALEALRQKNTQGKPIVIGFDAIQEAREAIDDGRLSATIAQDPVGLGEKAAQTVERLFKHESVEKEQILPPKAITRGPDVHEQKLPEKAHSHEAIEADQKLTGKAGNTESAETKQKQIKKAVAP
jgi:ribose transport system substrate-binding protein